MQNPQLPVTAFDAAVEFIKNSNELKSGPGDINKADIRKSYWQGDYCHIKDCYDRHVAAVRKADLRDGLRSAFNREQVLKGAAINTQSRQILSHPKAAAPFSIQSSTVNGEGSYQTGQFILAGNPKPLFTLNDIIKVEIITQAEDKNFAAKLGWSTAAFIGLGTIFSGGLGLLGAGAALLATGNNKHVSFLATLISGKQFILSTSDKIYLEIKASLL